MGIRWIKGFAKCQFPWKSRVEPKKEIDITTLSAWKNLKEADMGNKLDKQIEAAKEQLLEAERNAMYQKARIQELEVQKALVNKASREVLDWQASRCGQPWNELEDSILKVEVDNLTHEYAMKFGRSSVAIRFRIIKMCIEQIPNANIMAKLSEMIKSK